MKKTRSLRLTAVLLSLILVFSLIPGFALAADADETLTFIHTNDVHGSIWLEPYVKSVTDSYKELYGDDNVKLVSAGDIFGGGLAVAHLTGGESVVETMNAAGYDYVVPGNNDMTIAPYEAGALGAGELIIYLSGRLDAKMLAANFTLNGERPDTMQDYDIFETAGGVKVGIFGIAATLPDDDPDLRPYGYDSGNTIETATASVAELEALGCDIIVCVTHIGWTEAESTAVSGKSDVNAWQIADQVSGIDLIIDGHSHTKLENGYTYTRDDGSETLIVQASSNGNAIGVAELQISGGELVSSSSKLLEGDNIKAYGQDAEVQAVVDKWNDYVDEKYGEVVGTTDYFLNGQRKSASADGKGIRIAEQNLGNLVTDALRYALEDADVVMFPGFMIRASIDVGDITLLELYDVFANGGSVFVEEYTAAELYAKLEASIADASKNLEGTSFNQISGASFIYDAATAKLVSVTMYDGTKLNADDNDTVYTLAYVGIMGDSEPVLSGYADLVPVFLNYLDEVLGGTVPAYYAAPEGRIVQLAAESRFTDAAADEWYYDAVRYVDATGIFKGTSDTTFEPGKTMDRAMMITTFYRVLGSPEVLGGSTFTDVAPGAYYADAVAWAEQNGIAEGVGGGLFAPQSPVTREQFATILYRAFGGLNDGGGSALMAGFSDADKVSGWAKDAVEWALSMGYINGCGDGTLRPTRAMSRAEAAQLYLNLF